MDNFAEVHKNLGDLLKIASSKVLCSGFENEAL